MRREAREGREAREAREDREVSGAHTAFLEKPGLRGSRAHRALLEPKVRPDSRESRAKWDRLGRPAVALIAPAFR